MTSANKEERQVKNAKACRSIEAGGCGLRKASIEFYPRENGRTDPLCKPCRIESNRLTRQRKRKQSISGNRHTSDQSEVKKPFETKHCASPETTLLSGANPRMQSRLKYSEFENLVDVFRTLIQWDLEARQERKFSTKLGS